MAGPSINRGESRQDYCTPVAFIDAVEKKFGKLDIDLAADSKNTRCDEYVSADIDSLSLDWFTEFKNKQLWLNPPFGNIRPWAAHCAKFARKKWDVRGNKGKIAAGSARVFFLTPASTGANWFVENVWPFADIYFLQGRLTFGNEPTPYPKDCVLSVFGDDSCNNQHIWKWKENK